MKPKTNLLIGTTVVACIGISLWFRLQSSKRPQHSTQIQNVPNQTMPAPLVGTLADDELILNAPQLKLKRSDIMLGPFTPKSTPKHVRARLGPPINITDEPPYHDPNTEKDLPLKTWQYDGLSIHILDGRIAQITATSRQWPTGKGLKVGDNLDRTIALYGAPSETRGNDLVYCWEPGSSSFCPLTISIGSDKKVNSIAYDGWPE